MTVIGATWFFATDKKDLGFPMIKGLCWGLTWNMGTLALGSIIIYSGWFIYLVAGSLYHSVKDKVDASGEGCLNKIFKFIVAFYEFCITYANPQSYIEVVLKSSSFFQASKAAAEQTKKASKYDPRYLGLTDIILVFGVLTISIVTTILAKYWMFLLEYVSSSVFQSSVPLALCFLTSFIIAVLFVHIPIASVEVVTYCEHLTEEQKPLLDTKPA